MILIKRLDGCRCDDWKKFLDLEAIDAAFWWDGSGGFESLKALGRLAKGLVYPVMLAFLHMLPNVSCLE